MNTNNTRTMSLGQSLLFAITIVVVALVAFIAGTSSASAAQLSDDGETWLYGDPDTGSVAVITSVPFEDAIDQDMALLLIESMIDDELDRAKPITLDRDLSRWCTGASGRMEGDRMTVIGCLHDDQLTLVMATDPDVAIDLAENMIDDGEPTTPAGYIDMSE